MTDDLVKRLRDEDNDEPLNELLDAAADRIEKLEEALREIYDIVRKALEGKEPLERTENYGQGSEPWLNKE